MKHAIVTYFGLLLECESFLCCVIKWNHSKISTENLCLFTYFSTFQFVQWNCTQLHCSCEILCEMKKFPKEKVNTWPHINKMSKLIVYLFNYYYFKVFSCPNVQFHLQHFTLLNWQNICKL